MQKSYRSPAYRVKKNAKNESLFEKIGLLLLTALLTGFLVPYITNAIQSAKSKNEVVLQAQSKLIDDVSKTLMAYETLLMDIAWYKTKNGNDTSMYRKAYERYSEKSVELLTEWRIESIRAKQLSSNEIGNKLDSFQQKMFDVQDTPMNILRNKKDATFDDWDKMQGQNENMFKEARNLISELSIEMGITKKDLK